MNYHDKLWAVKQFVEENFDDPVELVIALGLTVDDMIRLIPDVLVENYHKFFEAHDNTEEELPEFEQEDAGLGEDWEE